MSRALLMNHNLPAWREESILDISDYDDDMEENFVIVSGNTHGSSGAIAKAPSPTEPPASAGSTPAVPSSASTAVDEYYLEPVSFGGGDSEGPWSPTNYDDLTGGIHPGGLERTSGENLLFTLQYNSFSSLEDEGMFTPSACSGSRQIATIGDNQPNPDDNPGTSVQCQEQEE